jgi:hypothetical protein
MGRVGDEVAGVGALDRSKTPTPDPSPRFAGEERSGKDPA